ncbi:pMGF 505-1R [African swine fever virus]|uniref:PMGF 505-1R n=1 Tax=African swine fever virus TaxID=10497 RepID=A0A6G8EZB3_ASF|nr:pMGF 505-1R [African swine fever virus]QPL11729.1 pMGF 505-1R [African swine fever virus]QPL11946.1 pMGF 505-1R [African swine fever virus]UCX55167.1 pMGF 505-1R [African swine fever virus]UFQ11430.1 pMGF 505-1R [African swine fever virus]
MFSLQNLCRKTLPDCKLPEFFDDYILQLLGLYWENHGTIQRAGNNCVLIQQHTLIPVNEALRIAASEENYEIVGLLLAWEGNLYYAIIGALEGNRYNLIRKYDDQIKDHHDILPFIDDPIIFHKCHIMRRCFFDCILYQAVKYSKFRVLLYFKYTLEDDLPLVHLLIEKACEDHNYEVIKWIYENLHVCHIIDTFDCVIAHKDLRLYCLGYTFIYNRIVPYKYHHLDILILSSLQLLHKVAAKGYLDFILETLKYDHNIDNLDVILTQATTYNHRKILTYFIPQSTYAQIEQCLFVAIKTKSSKKTLNLLLSHLNLSIKLIQKISQYVATFNSTNIIGILSMKRKKKIYLDIILTKFVKNAIFNKFVVRCMERFSINPERIVKMAARINKMMLVKKISEHVWKNHAARLKHLKHAVHTMKHKDGKNRLMNFIYEHCYYHMQGEEIFSLARFYAIHHAPKLFDVFYNCCILDTIRFKSLLLDCSHIIGKNAHDATNINIVNKYIGNLFAMGVLSKKEILQDYPSIYSKHYMP